MKSVKTVVLLVVALLLAPGLVRAHQLWAVFSPVVAAGVCPPVQNTLLFTIAYGPVTINDQDAPAGTIVEARTPRGEVAGCSAVSDPGHYSAMYIYGEDTTITPTIPGMREEETVAFYVNGVAATAVPTLTWTNDWELHQVDLSAAGASPPIADFTAGPTSGVRPLVVTFTNQSTGDYTASLWDLGNGVTSTLQSPTHTYTIAGVYDVTLTVSGPGGSDTLTRTNFITVNEPPPVSISVVKTVTPQGQVNYGDELTYTLVISAAPGAQVALYDPLTDTTFLRFVRAVAGVTYTQRTITGTLTITPTNQITISFAVEVGVPVTGGLTVSVTNEACVYPVDGTLDDCVWSSMVTNDAFRFYSVYLPLIRRGQ